MYSFTNFSVLPLEKGSPLSYLTLQAMTIKHQVCGDRPNMRKLSLGLDHFHE